MSKTKIKLVQMSLEQNQVLFKSVAQQLFKDIDSPVSKDALVSLEKGDYLALAKIKVDPEKYDSAYEFALDYQVASLLKKQAVFPVNGSKAADTLAKFMESESRCERTNDTLKQTLRTLKGWQASIPLLAQQKIAGILGRCPSLDELSFAFGPGATSTCKGSNVTLGDKLQSKFAFPFCARKAVMQYYGTYFRAIEGSTGVTLSGPASINVKVEITDCNELHLVPKTALIDRAICVEPHSIVPIQKGYGSWIRSRLLLNGIDLRKQADINRDLARLGSVDGSYATIDLSSASDTIALSTVFELLPFDWACALSDVRSPFTKLPDGTLIENQKFSSMGNGYTFELETLIFYALALAVRDVLGADGRISVFGDDIIVPTVMAEPLMQILAIYGFEVNTDKTFTKGPFRESCGSDYFRGVNVRPFFLKEQLTYDHEQFAILNGLRHWARRLNGDVSHDCDSIARRTWVSVFRRIRKELRLFGPAYLGDNVIHSSRRQSSGSAPMYLGVSRVRQVNVKTAVRSLGSFNRQTQLAVALCGGTTRLPLRKRVESLYIVEGPVPYWDWDALDWDSSQS